MALRIQAQAAGLTALLAAALAVSPVHAEPCPGTYIAHEPEIAAQLDLDAGGRFHYALAYGALDEMADGQWRWDGGHLLLASDPVTPPEVTLLSDEALADNRLQVDLDLPDGIALQYFNVVLVQPDGGLRGLQFAADGLDVALDPAHAPAALRIDLPALDFSSRSFPLKPGGHSLKLRFVPHDLGKAVLTDQPLTEEGSSLLLERHDRKIAFKREGGCRLP
jgi:hypothetical protein